MTLRIVEPEDWTTKAKCRGMDPDVFFPTAHEDINVEAAKKICNGHDGRPVCPVRAQCRALVGKYQTFTSGVWGGTSHAERRAERREEKRCEATG